MRVYIHTDLEGASGIWRSSQTSSDFPADYEYGKRCLTRDVNIVVAAAFDHGAGEVIVDDGHGSGGLNWDQVDPRASVERMSADWPHTCPRLSEKTDCAFIVGQHAMAGTQRAFLCHTQSSTAWFEYKINDVPHGELGQFAAIAGGLGVPVAMVAGDRAACEEAARLFPEMVTAEVKFACVRNQCNCHSQEKVARLLKEKTIEAMDKVNSGGVKPWAPDKPILLELTFVRTDVADGFERGHSRWRRVGARTFQRSTDDPRELYGA